MTMRNWRDAPKGGCEQRSRANREPTARFLYLDIPQCTAAPRGCDDLFDHLVGAGEKRRRHIEAECIRRLETDHQLELSWLQDRRFCRIRASKNLCSIFSPAWAIHLRHLGLPRISAGC